jgi:hypothetical protein
MLTQHRDPAPTQAPIARATIRFFRTAVLAVIALSIAACGGGTSTAPVSNSPPPVATPPPTPAPAPAPQLKGSVSVRATTPSGTPIGGVSVTLNGGFDGRTAITDASGVALFGDVPAGEARTDTWASGYFSASQRIAVTGDTVTRATVILERVTEAIPVVLATHHVASNDGTTLTVDIDLALLNENGTVRETLTAVDFALIGGSCDWDWCVVNTDGSDTGRGYSARVIDAPFNPPPTLVRPTMAAAILLDQSVAMAAFDPSGIRLQALNSFLESVTPPDTVALGTFQGNVAAPALTTYGGFTSDATSIRTAVSALAGRESGTSPLLAAMKEMIAFTVANTPAGSSTLHRTVVAVTSTWPEEECPDAMACQRAKLAVATAAQASDVSVVAIGDYGPATEIAARTNGAFAYVSDPQQLPVVFRALTAIVGHGLAYNRVRIKLQSPVGTFVPGRTAQGYLQVHIGPNTSPLWYLAIPI